MSLRLAPRDVLLLLLLTAAAVSLHGYHLGVQDQAIYLPSIKKLLNPSLYPHDAEFFVSQTRWILFDEAAAACARLTGSLEWTLLAGHLLTVFLVLLACLRLARLCFREAPAQWAGVCLVAAMLILPATGTQIPMVDNYVNPRGLATAVILLVWPSALAGRLWWILGVAVAIPIHPVMALLGGFHLGLQWWKAPRAGLLQGTSAPPGLLSVLVLAAALPSGESAWHAILDSRRDIFLLRWTWYEWIGVIVPAAFLWWVWRESRGKAEASVRGHVAGRLLVATGCGMAGALAGILPGMERLVLGQPMRVLQVVYIFFFLLLGGWLGRSVLRAQWARWAAFFVPLCGVMFFVQLRTFEGSSHFDWPGAQPRNAWVQAFLWVRANTPVDAKFALPFNFMRLPGEDVYGFRAWAERSRTADGVKDRAVAVVSPSLADAWASSPRLPDPLDLTSLQTMRRDFGVTWLVIPQPGLPGLPCPYANDVVMVCRIPEPVDPLDNNKP